LSKVASFGNEFIGAEVFYKKGNMHTVKYIREGEVVFTNMVFNDNRESGEKDSIDMAKKFVTQETRKHGE
jgi:hypothetical protein